jgi:hypothetical protein
MIYDIHLIFICHDEEMKDSNPLFPPARMSSTVGLKYGSQERTGKNVMLH